MQQVQNENDTLLDMRVGSEASRRLYMMQNEENVKRFF